MLKAGAPAPLSPLSQLVTASAIVLPTFPRSGPSRSDFVLWYLVPADAMPTCEALTLDIRSLLPTRDVGTVSLWLGHLTSRQAFFNRLDFPC